MNRTLRACTCINIGSQGALLDLGEATCPELPVESKLFVVLQLAGETVKLPGIVRHRKGNVLGIFFPIEGDPNFEEEGKGFPLSSKPSNEESSEEQSANSIPLPLFFRFSFFSILFSSLTSTLVPSPFYFHLLH